MEKKVIFKATWLLSILLVVVLALFACGAPEDVVVDEVEPVATVDDDAETPDAPDAEDGIGVQQDEVFAAGPAGAEVVLGPYDPFPSFDSFQESPFLTDMDLPPVEERLPRYPKVPNTLIPGRVEVTIGQFGGELRTVTPNAVWNPTVWSMNNEPLLNTPGILGEQITGNVLHRFEANDDYTEFTFFMREGMRWSDGEFVTTEDVSFAVESFSFNEELQGNPPDFLVSANGTPVDFEVLDRYTFRLTYDVPFGGLPIRLAIRNWTGYADLIVPAHFLRDFHIDFTDEAEIIANAAALGHTVEDWVTAFHAVRVSSWDINEPSAVGYPTLRPWINVGTIAGGQLTRFERNPYFWKVDQEGNQLPYIDTIVSHHVHDTETVTMMMIGGDVDFNVFETALVNMPLYLQYADANDYKVIMSDWHVTPADIFFIHSYPDEQWQSVVSDLRFRQAANYAFNNQEVIDSVYGGFARPSQVINPEFNPARAEELLDEMGMTLGADGFRTCPNGNPFSINLDMTDRTPDMRMVGEFFVAFMADVGIRVNMRMLELGLFADRQAENEVQATILWSEIIWYNVGHWIFLDGIGVAYYEYFTTGGETGMEPPPLINDLFTYIGTAFWVPLDEARGEFDKYVASWGENIWGLQFLESVQQPIIANRNLMNVDIVQPTWGIGLAFGGEIFYFDQE